MIHSVHLNDANKNQDAAETYFIDAEAWAIKHCISFEQVIQHDVSDFSYSHDTIAEYVFADEKDALIFKLKWL